MSTTRGSVESQNTSRPGFFSRVRTKIKKAFHVPTLEEKNQRDINKIEKWLEEHPTFYPEYYDPAPYVTFPQKGNKLTAENIRAWANTGYLYDREKAFEEGIEHPDAASYRRDLRTLKRHPTLTISKLENFYEEQARKKEERKSKREKEAYEETRRKEAQWWLDHEENMRNMHSYFKGVPKRRIRSQHALKSKTKKRVAKKVRKTRSQYAKKRV